jgi:hypothetical protein
MGKFPYCPKSFPFCTESFSLGDLPHRPGEFVLSGTLPVHKSYLPCLEKFPSLSGRALIVRESFPSWMGDLPFYLMSFPPCMEELPLTVRESFLPHCTEEFLSVYQRVPSMSGRVSLPVCGNSLTVRGSSPFCMGRLPHCLPKRVGLPFKPIIDIHKELICFFKKF